MVGERLGLVLSCLLLPACLPTLFLWDRQEGWAAERRDWHRSGCCMARGARGERTGPWRASCLGTSLPGLDSSTSTRLQQKQDQAFTLQHTWAGGGHGKYGG